jgi:H+/Cl- antiporter ClcA
MFNNNFNTFFFFLVSFLKKRKSLLSKICDKYNIIYGRGKFLVPNNANLAFLLVLSFLFFSFFLSFFLVAKYGPRAQKLGTQEAIVSFV